ncbi:hypothetical protein [Tateyamaria sp. ANG-S1]|uniref:hypothetical protein n=1 Tax=Tateyamaria sp. ANG-S1 TaxID=1577905 RepID=UPI00057FE9D4|nr:hypothetical protein [Tateyamaria sp. ANG-S1]KIC49514.1 hypothetical protein RA29_07375 [Tateyamaria sp. ANG-S1]
MKEIALGALLLMAMGLGACSTVVPATLYQMRGLDPLSADPADIALRVDLPEGLGLLPGSGSLRLRATDADGAEMVGSYPITMVGDVLQVEPASHADLRALQAEIRARKAADPDGVTGSLSIDFEPCSETADIPDRVVVSVDIRLAADGPFLPLLRDAPLADALEMAALEELTLCP